MPWNNDVTQQLSDWETIARRKSSMNNSRRSSLLSMSIFDLGFGSESHDPDPYAPLSLDHLPVSPRRPGGPIVGVTVDQHRYATIDRLLGDRSEASIPSIVSASSYGSHSSSYSAATQNVMDHNPYHSPIQPTPILSAKLPVASLLSSPSGQAFQQGIVSPASAVRAAVKPAAVQAVVKSKEVPKEGADAPNLDDEEDEMNQHRFKPFHEEKWSIRYKELLEFHKENGHAAVPHTYPANPQLARWVKRQRRQYKLRKDNRQSTMTAERLDLLNSIGFIWDSHDVNWREKLDNLAAFRKEHGHCNVPSNYQDKKLATWVKCQRRQYKLYWDGKPSAMTPERILELEKVGFEWEIRSTVPRPAPVTAQSEDFNLLYQTISDL
jgi:hypothetical protein